MSMGHNNPPAFASFDEVVRENLARGLLATINGIFVQISRDPRLGHRHFRIFAEVVAAMKHGDASSYPGYKRLAEMCDYSEGGVRKTLSELIGWGYLVSARRKPEGHQRALAHYTVNKPSLEQYQTAIDEWVQTIRDTPKRKKPTFWGDDVTQGGNVTTRGNVTHGGNMTVRGDVTSSRNMTKADVTSMVPTVTSNNISNKITTRESVSSTVFKKQPSVAKNSNTTDWAMLNPYNVAAAAECSWVKSRLEVFGEFRAELLAEVGGDEIKLRAVLDGVASYGGKETATGLTLQRYVRSKFSQAQRWFEIDQAKLNRGKPASVKDETPENRAKAMLETPAGKQMVREMGHEKAKEFITKKFQESAR